MRIRLIYFTDIHFVLFVLVVVVFVVAKPVSINIEENEKKNLFSVFTFVLFPLRASSPRKAIL